MPEIDILSMTSMHMAWAVPSQTWSPASVPSAVVMIPWPVCRSPIPRIIEPRVESIAESPEPRVAVSPPVPVPWIVIAPVSSVIPRVPVHASECYRPVVCPWIEAVIGLVERIVRDGDRCAGSREIYDCRFVFRDIESVCPVSFPGFRTEVDF